MTLLARPGCGKPAARCRTGANQLLASLAKLRSLAVAAVVKRGGRRMAAFLKTISMPVPWAAALLLILLGATAARAQENTAEEAARRQAVLATLPPDAARRVFGLTATPAPGPSQPIGSYTKGCLSGAVEMPADGPVWQVMRPSRNRAWGHPALIAFLQRLASRRRNRRVARVADRRHGSAARWPDAYRACFASARHRKRHLADADAGSPSRSGRAQRDVGHQRRRRKR